MGESTYAADTVSAPAPVLSALVVAGDKDTSPRLTVAGADWLADPYFLSPGPKSLLTLFDAEHGLGGVSGCDAAETTAENPSESPRSSGSPGIQVSPEEAQSPWRTTS